MKLSFLFFTVIALSLSASTYSQTVRLTIDKTDVTIAEIFSDIEAQSEFSFLLSHRDVNVNRRVSVHIYNALITDVLSAMFAEKDISYRITDRHIILFKADPMIAATGFALQGSVITGTVTDSDGVPLPGVNVLLKGTMQGTVTDVVGVYSLQVPDGNATLVFSFIGYTSQEFLVGDNRIINVTLSEETREIEEVVVVGYGTMKKVNLTGAVSQITDKDLKDRPVTKLTQALQGVIPNLNITFGSGQPGTSGTLNIRGTTSINGGSPLVLIDGIPGNIDRINVNDVETISVLKDASASAVYGARAAFGVILVTTKSAKEGQIQISYQNNFGWTTHATKTDFITEGYTNARINDDMFYRSGGSHLFRYTDEDWAEMEARINDKTEHPDRPWVVVKQVGGQERYNYYGNFDWFNYFYSKFRPKQSHDLNISGSEGNIRYMLSGNYTREQGIFRIAPDVDNRYNFRVKLESNVTKWLTVSSNTRYFKSDYHWSGYNQAFTPSSDNLIWSNDPQFYSPYYHYHPQYVPLNPDGTFTGNSQMSNYTMGFGLHAIQGNDKSVGRSTFSEFSSTFQAVLKLAEGLTVTGNYAYTHDLFQRYYRSVKVMYSVYPGVLENWSWTPLNTDQFTERMYASDTHVINTFANYSKSLGRHNLQAMVGFNQELVQYKNIQASGLDLLSETLNDLNLITGDTPAVTGGAFEYALRGAFGRINYDYAGKYLFEASGRYDGTSRFPKKSRFGFFPSFSAGYRISEEAFFAPIKQAVNNLKFRYSYGTLGNQDVSNYAYISEMSAALTTWLHDGSKLKRVSLPAPVANNLTWESSTTNNIGLDADLLKSRLSLSVDMYTRDTHDMLTQGEKLPAVFGASEPRENAADLQTKGYEITLGWRDNFTVSNKPLHYSITAVFSDATAKITKFDNPTGLLSSYRVGQQFGEIWGYVTDGFFQTDEEAQEYTNRINVRQVQNRGNYLTGLGAYSAGDVKILDLNEDNILNTGAGTVDDPGDRRIIGNTTARYSFGLSLSANWNGIDLYVLFQGIGKKNWYPNPEATMFWGPYSRAYSSFIPTDFMDNVWSEENPNAYFPRPIGYLALSYDLRNNNTMYLQDLAYCKLRNLTVGYTLPAHLFGKVGISRLRVYAGGENLVTWTKLKSKYIDPEETMWNSDGRTYPMGKTYSFGVELSF